MICELLLNMLSKEYLGWDEPGGDCFEPVWLQAGLKASTGYINASHHLRSCPCPNFRKG